MRHKICTQSDDWFSYQPRQQHHHGCQLYWRSHLKVPLGPMDEEMTTKVRVLSTILSSLLHRMLRHYLTTYLLTLQKISKPKITTSHSPKSLLTQPHPPYCLLGTQLHRRSFFGHRTRSAKFYFQTISTYMQWLHHHREETLGRHIGSRGQYNNTLLTETLGKACNCRSAGPTMHNTRIVALTVRFEPPRVEGSVLQLIGYGSWSDLL
jgi:hypothetical protein